MVNNLDGMLINLDIFFCRWMLYLEFKTRGHAGRRAIADIMQRFTGFQFYFFNKANMAIGRTLHTSISYQPMIYYYYHHGPILLEFATAVNKEYRQRLWWLTDNNYTSYARITTYKCHYDHSSDTLYNILHICTYTVRLCRDDLSIKVFLCTT